MKKLYINLGLLLLFSAALGIKAQTPVTAYVGNWMLDKEKTAMSKDFPQKLKNYKMAVSGTEDAFNVRNQIEGVVEIESAGHGIVTPVTESASMARGGAAAAPGIESSGSGTGRVNYGGTMALTLFREKNATYNLNNTEIKTDTEQGQVRIKAKAEKGGKSLQFVTIRRVPTQRGEMEITIREVWKIADDGKSMKFQRIVETPTARDEINMVLSKVS